MRKFVFMMTMLFALSMSAQHVKESSVFDNVYSSVSAGLTNPTNHWKFETNGGINSYIRPTFQIEVGKAMNTYYTMAIEMDARVNTTGAKTLFDEATASWLHKVNVLNLFQGYKERRFEVYPVLGVGWGHNFSDGNDYGVLSTAIEMDWKLNDAWSIMVKPQIRWNQIEHKLNVNRSDVGVNVGVIYKFNKFGNRNFIVCNYDEVVRSNEELNDEINALRLTVTEQRDTIDKQNMIIHHLNQRTCEEKVNKVVVDNTIQPTVGFLLNEYKITPDKLAYLYKVAEQYKDSKLIIIGYADKNTGTTKYNQELSMKRAEAVKNALVEFGLNPDNIELKALGDSEQPFVDNDMNRVVIIKK